MLEQNHTILPITLFDSYVKNEVTIRSEETVVPGTLKTYSCGPTVYYYQHIGNMRAAWLPDMVSSVAKLSGWNVEWVLNITDVGHLVGDGDEGQNVSKAEDKLEKGAKREGKTVQEIARKYFEDYVHQCESLNIDLPKGKYNPKATEYIEEQMMLALSMLASGRAYLLQDGIYFDSQANRDLDVPFTTVVGDNAYTGREIENTEKNAADFALWKFVSEESLQKWKFEEFAQSKSFLEKHSQDSWYNISFLSQWGCPGWHSECVAMISEVLGKHRFSGDNSLQFNNGYEIDIHFGGEDHIDVHHKNEILQSEALGFHLSKYWVHNKFVTVDGKKMSKSLGNVYLVIGKKEDTGFESIEERGFDPLAYRLMLMEHHYSEQMNFTWEKLEQSQNRLFNLRKEVAKIRSFAQSPNLETMNDDKYETVKSIWLGILNDNLNVPKFLEEYQDFLTSVVNRIQVEQKLAVSDHNLLSKFASEVLKLKLFELELPVDILAKAEDRWEFKQQKQYQEADQIRQEVVARGWQIDDYSWGWGIWWKGV